MNKQREKIHKSKKERKSISKVVIVLVIIAALVLFTFLFYFFKSNKLYNLVKDAKENEELSYSESMSFLMLNGNAAKIIAEKNLTINVEFGQAVITFLKDNISNFKSLDFNFKLKKFDNISDLNGAKVAYLERIDFNKLETNVPEVLNGYENLSLFALDGENIKDISDNLKKENDRIIINKSEYAVNGYILAYVPVKNIKSDLIKEDGVIYIAKDEKKKLEVNLEPGVATNKNYEINCMAEDGIIEIIKENQDYYLKGNIMGDSEVIIKTADIEKNFKVHVSNYAKDINLNSTNVTIQKDKSFTIIASAVPNDAENSNITFENKSEDILTLEGNIITAKEYGEGTIVVKTAEPNVITKEIKVDVVEKKIEVIDGITYINGVLIANKTYSLPSNYNPGKLLDETIEAFNNLKKAASNEGLSFWISSGFRSYSTQQRLYANYVSGYGKAAADTFSARAGHSEHQTGLAMDVNYIEDWFGDTKEGKWLAENAHKYGFIIRYPKSKEEITGYKYEPWHIRYLGVELATSVYQSGLCLEEYLNITSKYEGE